MAATLELLIKAKDEASGTLDRLQKKSGGLGQTMGKTLKFGALGAAGGIAALGAIGFKAVQAAAEQQAVDAQLAAVLKSTKNAAGLTAGEIKKMASSLQRATTFTDDTIQSGQNLLLTFTKIGKDVFPDATETMLDMSQALGQDTKSSAIQLGKALNDPIRGVAALRRVGVSFTKAQQDQIKALVESGDLMGAQKLILGELKTEFGGSARAAAETFGGRMKQLQNVLGELLETIGFALLPIVTKLAQKLSAFLLDHQADIERFAKLVGEGLVDAFAFLGRIAPKVFAFFKAEVLPVIKQIIPHLIDFGRTVISVATGIARFLVPALDTLADLWANVLKPALDLVLPILRTVGQFLLDHKALLIALAAAILLITNPWLAVVAVLLVVLAKWDAISQVFTKTIPNAIDSMLDKVRSIPVIGFIFEQVWNQVRARVKLAIQLILNRVKFLFDTIRNTFAFFKAIFTGDWDAAWKALRAQANAVLNLIKSDFRALFGFFRDTVTGNILPLLRQGKRIGGAIMGGLKQALQVTDIGKGFANAIIRVINSAIDKINAAIPDKIGLPGPLPDIDLPDNPLPKIPELIGGGRIAQTGLAVVHKGEMVVPPGRGREGVIQVVFNGPVYGLSDFDAQVKKAVREAARLGGFRGVLVTP